MKYLKNAEREEIKKIENKLRNAYQDLGYAKARMKIAEDKIKYFEKTLEKWKGKTEEA